MDIHIGMDRGTGDLIYLAPRTADPGFEIYGTIVKRYLRDETGLLGKMAHGNDCVGISLIHFAAQCREQVAHPDICGNIRLDGHVIDKHTHASHHCTAGSAVVG